jgi:hypothetical protein
MTLASVGVAAQAAPDLSLPSPPDGYETQHIGSIVWTFPESERGRVAELIEDFEQRWAEVETDFGVTIDDQLVIRVARNPREMRAMAPVGAPPPDYATGVAYSPHLQMLQCRQSRCWGGEKVFPLRFARTAWT